MDTKGAIKVARECLERSAGIVSVAIYGNYRFLEKLPDDMKDCDRARDARKELEKLQNVFKQIEHAIDTLEEEV